MTDELCVSTVRITEARKRLLGLGALGSGLKQARDQHADDSVASWSNVERAYESRPALLPSNPPRPISLHFISLSFASLASKAATCWSKSVSEISAGIPAAALTRLLTTELSDIPVVVVVVRG